MNKTLIRSILLALIISLFTIVPALAYTYSAYITITESSGNDYTQFPFTVFMDNDYLATQGYITNDGLDINVTVNGAPVFYKMVVSDRILFISDLAANHTITPLLTTGNDPPFPSFMYIIVGNEGYIETPDNATIELGNNEFEISMNGYCDTSLGVNKYLLYKDSAINLQNTAAGQLTADFNGNTIIANGVSSGDHQLVIGNSAAKLDSASNQYIQVPDSDLLELGNSDFTISTWVNFTDVVGTYVILCHRVSDASPNDKYQITWDNVSNTIDWKITAGGLDIMKRWANFIPVAGTWYNFIFTRSGNDFDIYIDGALTGATETQAITVPEMNHGMYLGALVAGTGSMNGKYQDFRLLSRAITAGEIADYQTCTYTDDTDLQLYLRCDESVGYDLYDYSGNGLDSEAIPWCYWGSGVYDYLKIDSVREGISFPKTAIPDNANNWFFMQNNSLAYVNSIAFTINELLVTGYSGGTSMFTAIVNPASPYAVGTATFITGTKTVTGAGGAAWTRDMIGGQIKCDADAVYYKIVDVPNGTTITLNTEYLETGGAGAAYTIDSFNLTTTLDDGYGGNDGTITFGANPLGVVTGISALTSSTVITSTPTVAPDLVNVESNQGDLISTPYPNPTLATNLLTPWFTPWSQLSNIPLVAFFLILGTVILIVLVVWIMKKTNNQLIASFVLIAGESMLWKLGIYELWPVIVTAIICFAIIVWERKPSI